MRRITLVLSIMGLAAGGAIGAMACGGDDDDASVPVVTVDDAATTSGGDTGASSSSGSPTNPDAASSSSSGGSTPTSNPGQLTCGSIACDAGSGGGGGGSRVCCARPTGEGACTRQNDCENDGPDGGLALECDEAADCDDGDRCCFIVERNNDRTTSSTECRARCVTGGGGGTARPQVCKTSAECGDGGACTQKTCGGFKLFVCGTPEGCN